MMKFWNKIIKKSLMKHHKPLKFGFLLFKKASTPSFTALVFIIGYIIAFSYSNPFSNVVLNDCFIVFFVITSDDNAFDPIFSIPFCTFIINIPYFFIEILWRYFFSYIQLESFLRRESFSWQYMSHRFLVFNKVSQSIAGTEWGNISKLKFREAKIRFFRSKNYITHKSQ